MTSLNTRRLFASTALLASLGTPAAVAVSASAVTTGCLLGSPGPSNVAVGKQYRSGDPTYDQFFEELYGVQVGMGQAPDRESAIRGKVATAAGVDAASAPAPIADAVDKRATTLAKAGVTLKLTTTGLEEGGAPAAKLAVTGTAADPKDQAFVTALDQATQEAAALLGEVRKTKPVIERLSAQVNALEPGIDQTFRKGGARKKSEVTKNLEDAKRMIPLMASRADDVARQTAELLQKLEKVANTTPPPPPVTLPETPDPAATGKKGKDAKKGKGGAKPAAEGASAPAAKPAEAKPAEAKPKPPPADDFEP